MSEQMPDIYQMQCLLAQYGLATVLQSFVHAYARMADAEQGGLLTDDYMRASNACSGLVSRVQSADIKV
jgi:hypothetical protein